MLAWMLLVGTGLPIDTVDVVEVNYCYQDDWSRPRFAPQVIFWRVNGSYGRLEVAEWCWLSAVDVRPHGKGCVVTDGANRRCAGRLLRVTHTNYDPEAADRKLLDSNLRLCVSWY